LPGRLIRLISGVLPLLRLRRLLLLLICRGLPERGCAGETDPADGENCCCQNLLPGHMTSYPISQRSGHWAKLW
jgi:hypothetical protein